LSARLVGRLPLEPGDTAIVDEVENRLMVLRWHANGRKPTFLLFDPLRLEKLGETEIPYDLPSGARAHPRLYAWDEAGRRLLVVAYGSTDDELAHRNPLLLTLGPEGRTISAAPMASFPPGVALMGMSYDASEDRVYLVGQLSDPVALGGTYAVMVHAVDRGSGRSAWPAGAQVVDSCQRVVANSRQAAVVRHPGSGRLFVGCGTGNLLLSPQPGLPGVAEIDIEDPGRLAVTIHPIAGSYSAGESHVDAAEGKFVMVSQGTGQPVQAAWVFDLAHRVFTGVVSAGSLNVIDSAVEPGSGLLFVGIDGKLLVSSTRLRNTPQALTAALPLGSGTTLGIVLMRRARRLLVPTREGIVFRPNVYDVTLPDFVDPAEDDPDARTVDAPEAAGKVEADFGGDAQAFGMRVHQVAGANGVLQNIFPSRNDYVAFIGGNAKNLTLGQVPLPPLNDGSRDVYFARVAKAHLSQGEATATAIEADRDPVTEADWTRATGGPWPYAAAACADFGGGEEERSVPGATTRCDTGRGRVEVRADHDNAASAPEAVSAGGSSSSATLARARSGGLRVAVAAEARDVSVGGVVRFGRIASESVTQAGGRPGTAVASYVRRFENVSMPGYQCGLECDEAEVVARMNTLLGARFRAELPAARVAATPRGAQADASREPWQHRQDVVLNDQAESEQQVAALRVTYLNDNAQRSRVVFEFGATDATAGYRLFALGAEGGGLDSVFAGSTFGSGDGDGDGMPGAASFGVPSLGGGGGPVAGAPTERWGGDGGGLLRRLGRGLAIALLGRDHTVLNALLWALLATPVFLVARRRYLLRLVT
jgi:hypothetical protein